MSEDAKKPDGESKENVKPDGDTGTKEGVTTPLTESEQLKELRKENKDRRLKNEALEKEAKEAKEQATKALNQVEEYKRQSNDRIIRAELRAQATAAGMHDLDGLKLADLSTVKLDDNGDVIGADELITKLKETKPYLFKEF